MRDFADWMLDRVVDTVFFGALVVVYSAIAWALLASASGSQLTLGPVRLQEAEQVETDDTVLDRGETVAVFDALDDASATLRVGDGTTPGGRIVSDAWSVRVPTRRVLGPDEYALIPGGLAEWTAGAWHLVPAGSRVGDEDNFGSLTIKTDQYIAGVEVSGVFVHTTVYVAPSDFISLTKEATVTGREQFAPGGDSLYYEAQITNLVVFAWQGAHLAGGTADMRHVEMLVRHPLGDLEPVSRGWVENRLQGREADSWSDFPALDDLRLNWQDTFYHPYMRAGSDTSTSWRLRWQHPFATNYVDVFSAAVSNMTYGIVAWEQPTPTNVVLWVDDAVPFESAPIVQANTNLPAGAWFDLPTTSPWPTSEWITADSGLIYRGYRLDAISPDTSPIFYRVSATNNPAAQTNLLEFGLPVKMSGDLDMAGYSIINVGTGSIHMADGRVISSATVREWERSAQRVRQTERGGGVAVLLALAAWAAKIIRRRTGYDIAAPLRLLLDHLAQKAP